MPVLPHDAVGARVDDDDAIVAVVVEEDVAVGERLGKRRMLELGVSCLRLVAPPNAAATIEDLELAGARVVDRDVESSADLVGVRGVREARRVPGVDNPAGERKLVDPVAVDLGDEEVSVAHRERSVGAAPVGGRSVITGLHRRSEDPAGRMPSDANEKHATVLDVGDDDPPTRKEQRVVGVPEMVATAPRHSRSAVPIHEPATRDVDDRYELFVFLRHDRSGQLRYLSVFGPLLNTPTRPDCSDAIVGGTPWDANRTKLDPAGISQKFVAAMPHANIFDGGDGLNTAVNQWVWRGHSNADYGLATGTSFAPAARLCGGGRRRRSGENHQPDDGVTPGRVRRAPRDRDWRD